MFIRMKLNEQDANSKAGTSVFQHESVQVIIHRINSLTHSAMRHTSHQTHSQITLKVGCELSVH